MPYEPVAAALVAAIIGMGRIEPGRYVLWAENVALRWMVPIVALQILAFASSGVVSWALADVISVEGFKDGWLLNGCLWGVTGYIFLGVQLNAFDFDKAVAAWMPLRVVANFGRTLLDYLAGKHVDSLTDAELVQRAFSYYWRDHYSRTNVSASAKRVVYRNICQAKAQLGNPDEAADGRGRLRAYVRAAMDPHRTGEQ